MVLRVDSSEARGCIKSDLWRNRINGVSSGIDMLVISGNSR